MGERNILDVWGEAIERKNTTLCAGIDPSDYVMGRSEKGEGLPAGTNKRDWALKYIEAVAPYTVAIKPNLRYWLDIEGDMETLQEMAGLAHEKGLIAIQDSKEADIGSTNDAGIFNAAVKGYDFITVAAFAGNFAEAAKQGADRRISTIGMCLMSNPEYEKEKNMWRNVSDDVANYDPKDIKIIDELPHVRRYQQLARDANRFGLAGIVIGAPSSKNHIKNEEIERARHYFGPKGLILVPGIGAQGGEISQLTKHFGINKLIANVGRALMFPKGAYSTSEEQADAAKQYFGVLETLRNAA